MGKQADHLVKLNGNSLQSLGNIVGFARRVFAWILFRWGWGGGEYKICLRLFALIEKRTVWSACTHETRTHTHALTRMHAHMQAKTISAHMHERMRASASAHTHALTHTHTYTHTHTHTHALTHAHQSGRGGGVGGVSRWGDDLGC